MINNTSLHPEHSGGKADLILECVFLDSSKFHAVYTRGSPLLWFRHQQGTDFLPLQWLCPHLGSLSSCVARRAALIVHHHRLRATWSPATIVQKYLFVVIGIISDPI